MVVFLPADRKAEPILSFQRRFCLTLLRDTSELEFHTNFFGPFSLELTVDKGRQLGAMPTIYVPQPLDFFDDPRWRRIQELGSGNFIRLSASGDLGTCAADSSNKPSNFHDELAMTLLFELRSVYEALSWLLKKAESEGVPSPDWAGAEHIFSENQREMDNRTPPNSRTAKLSRMLGALQFLTGLFYHVDNVRRNETPDRALHYYRQQEWRVFGNFLVENVNAAFKLSPDEVKELMTLNADFYGEQIVWSNGNSERVAACRYLKRVGGAEIHDYFDRLHCPKEAAREVTKIVRRYSARIDVVAI